LAAGKGNDNRGYTMIVINKDIAQRVLDVVDKGLVSGVGVPEPGPPNPSIKGSKRMNITDYITPVSGLEYFICMVDFGKGRGKPSGFGADVQPEFTRNDIIIEVADCILHGRNIVHVRHVIGNDVQDVTHEIVGEALSRIPSEDLPSRADRLASTMDHARKLRVEA